MFLKFFFATVAGTSLALANFLPSGSRVGEQAALTAAPVTSGAAAVAADLPALSGSSAEVATEATANTSAEVERAVSQLSSAVGRTSHGEALRYAFRAYFNYKAANPREIRNPYLYFVDFGLSSGTARGYVFDMDRLTVVRGPFHVSHGRGSAPDGSSTPTRFLNVNGSKATSLGLYVAQETYAFNGKSGGRAYRSVGLRMKGVSGKFNDRARARGIVAHGAPYVTNGNAGRSEGCPAMTQALASELLPRLANGGMVFHFSPRDAEWMRSDPWASPGRS